MFGSFGRQFKDAYIADEDSVSFLYQFDRHIFWEFLDRYAYGW
jgi:hypothetical protein